MEKRKVTILYGVLLILMLFGFFTSAQDVSFSQFYTNPVYLNPAFAGSAGVPRIALQYRDQWHSFSNAFSTYNASFDFPVKKLQGGLGLFILNDSQAGNSYNTLQVNAAYSVFIRVSENFRLHGAVQAGINHHSLNIEKLIFPDNLDPVYGNHGISRELEYFNEGSFSFSDFATGVLLYSQRFFGGLAVHHLAQPGQSFYSDTDFNKNLPRKYTAHFGARLPVFLYGHHRKKFDIAPHLVMQHQGSFSQMNYGLFATKWGLSTGVWFRQNFGLRYDAVTLLVGFYRRKWQLTYSYDFAVSGLWGDTGGTSEVSLVFVLKQIKENLHLPFYDVFEDEFGVQ